MLHDDGIYEKQQSETNDINSKDSVFDHQEGGNHYKNFKIQPVEFCHKNEFDWCQSNVIKYVTRHKNKNGIEDIKKALHYLKFIADMDYNVKL